MTAYKCDRCGKYFTNEDRKNFLSGHGQYVKMLWQNIPDGYLHFPDSSESNVIDLCPNCLESFDNWIKGGANERT